VEKREHSLEHGQEKKDDIPGEESKPNNEAVLFADGDVPLANPAERGGEQKTISSKPRIQRKTQETKDLEVSQKRLRVEKRAQSLEYGQEKKDDIPKEESKPNNEAVQFADGALPPATPAERGGGERKTTQSKPKIQRLRQERKDLGVAQKEARMEKRAQWSDQAKKDDISGEVIQPNSEATSLFTPLGRPSPGIKRKTQEKKCLGETQKRARMEKHAQSSEYGQGEKDDISGEVSQPSNEAASFSDGVLPPDIPAVCYNGGE
jgi:hypothetical protein